MNKRTLGFLVVVLAFLGGINALYSLFFTSKSTGPPINPQGAGGFASAFCSAYFAYSNDTGFHPINTFTGLRDKRRAGDNLISQEVVSAQPLMTTQLEQNYIQAKVLVNLRSKVKVKGEYVEKIEDISSAYVVSLRLLEEQGGYRIVHYPAIQPYELPTGSSLPYPPGAKDEIVEAIKPVLTTFCRAFFVSQNTGDITNFFTSGAQIPKPLAGKFEFLSLEQLEVYGEKKPYLAYVTARVIDKDTGMESSVTLELFVTVENQKYVIESMEL